MTEASAPELVDVWLLNLPVALHARAEERHEELLREFSHIAHADADAAIPQRLLELVAEVRTRYAPIGGSAREQLLAARRAGVEAVDVRLPVPSAAGRLAADFARGLEEADAFCRSGSLLTLAAPRELVQFRRWLFGEVLRQVAGEAPRPWPGDAGEIDGSGGATG